VALGKHHPIEAVVAAGLREADDLAERYGLAPGILQPLRQAAKGDWGPYQPGMPLDAVATVASVVHVLREATSLAKALKCAVALGGRHRYHGGRRRRDPRLPT
jgi:hypothetical protein